MQILSRSAIKRIKKHWQLYLLILFPMMYIILFHYIPMYGVQIAFKDFNMAEGIWKSPWIGLEHFKEFIGSYNFLNILVNTLSLSVYSLVAGFPFPIILAISLNECMNKKFKKFVQTVTYAPYFISTVILCSMLIQLLSIRGNINSILEMIGLDRINFMAESSWFSSIYVWSGVWQKTGYLSILYLAALTSIDPTLYEASIIDGASIMQKIWNIDIPALLPITVILLILNIGSIMNVGFDKVYLLQNPLNQRVSEIIQTYVYKMGIQRANFDFSAAVGLFNSIINFILLCTANKISKMVSGTSLW